MPRKGHGTRDWVLGNPLGIDMGSETGVPPGRDIEPKTGVPSERTWDQWLEVLWDGDGVSLLVEQTDKLKTLPSAILRAGSKCVIFMVQYPLEYLLHEQNPPENCKFQPKLMDKPINSTFSYLKSSEAPASFESFIDFVPSESRNQNEQRNCSEL